jgi:hypothetical protein
MEKSKSFWKKIPLWIKNLTAIVTLLSAAAGFYTQFVFKPDDNVKQELAIQVGDYLEVKVPKSYFYSTPNYKTQTTKFLIEGDNVKVDKVVGEFVYASFYNDFRKKETSGYLRQDDLEKK